MSKPYRNASPGVELDLVVSLPAPVVERIEAQAKARGETVEGWCEDALRGLVEGSPEVPPEELAFDVRMALAKDPGAKGMDELAMRVCADRIVKHLAQSRLRFLRMAPLPPSGLGGRPARAGRSRAASLSAGLAERSKRVEEGGPACRWGRGRGCSRSAAGTGG